MSEQTWFMALSGEVVDAINTQYTPRLEKWIREDEIQGRTMFLAQTAVSFAPNPITVPDLLARTPYMSAAQAESNLALGVEDGILTKVDEQSYRLTDYGCVIAVAVPKLARELAADLDEMLPADSDQLAALLCGVVETAVASDLADKTAILTSRKFDPGANAPVLERIRRYINDLTAYRDDAHVTAWRAYGLDGHEWEAFSHVHGEFVYGEPVATGGELAEKMGGFRGYDAAAYDAALQKVAEMGWLINENGRYTATEKGNEIRTAVEAETDSLFYTPWVNLSATDAEQMQALMTALRDALQPPTAQQVRTTAEQAYEALAGLYWPVLQEKNEEIGFDGWDLFITRRAMVFADGLTLDFMKAHFPYEAPSAVQAKVDGTAARGFITGEDPYLPTEKGTAGVQTAIGSVTEMLGQLAPMAEPDATQLLALLQKLNEAVVTAEAPADKTATASAHNLLDEEAPVLWQISQHLGILNAFHEEAHLGAWRSMVDVSGQQWEAFSHVWGENVWGDPVNTAVDMAEKMKFRGYELADYTAVLQDCVARGWLTETDGVYTITTAGSDLRQQAEAKTDELFYAPWEALRGSERLELNDLLTRLRAALQPADKE